jgi:argininosuccinate synthase
VETFSFKSRDLSRLGANALTAQMVADAREALRYYGETLNIRRPSLHLRDSQVQVHRVRLIYEGGALKPKRHEILDDTLRDAQNEVQGVEVLVE